MRSLMSIAALAAALLVSACDTTEGMHRDAGSPGQNPPHARHR